MAHPSPATSVQNQPSRKGQGQRKTPPNGALAHDDEAEQLRRERDRFVALAFCGADVLLELDGDNVVVFAGGATNTLLGQPPDLLCGTSVTDLVQPRDKKTLEIALDRTSADSRIQSVPLRLVGRDGPTPMLHVNGLRFGEVGSHTYLTLRIARKEKSSARDVVTRHPDNFVLDKNSFVRVASQEIQDARMNGEDCKFTLLDLEEYDDLCARLDADAQDQLSETIGSYIRATSWRGDTTGQFDGNQFGLVHGADADIEQLCNEIKAAAVRIDPKGEGIAVTASTLDVDATGLGESETGKAMLYAIGQFHKSPKEFTIATLSQGITELATRTADRISSYRTIISTGEFDIAFQPICDIKTRRAHHFEALARFNKGGVNTNPFEFVTFAEEVGIICEFDLCVVEKVLGWIKTFNSSGYKYMIAVNISGRSLATPVFVDKLMRRLESASSERENILFEITESAKIVDLVEANNVIQALREEGHIVCLDDFGAGAAAFQYIGALDVDVVKIDGSYIVKALHSRRGRALLKAMAGMCGDLGIMTVAECVEKKAHLAMVADCGINFGQGYLFGAPKEDISVFDAPRPDVWAHGERRPGRR